MTIVSPPYSFIKFDGADPTPACCKGDSNFCIPVITETDTYFQVIVRGNTAAEAQNIFNLPITKFELLLFKGTASTTVGATVLRNWTLSDSLQFTKFRTSPTDVTLVWKNLFKNIATYLSCDECFQVCLVITIAGDATYYFSNCMIRKCDDCCYSSVIEYYNEENYAGFDYCNAEQAVNRVRLPLYLTQPQTKEEKSVYRKSNGSIRQLKSLLTKEYQALTEYLPEHIHDKVIVALAHDNVRIITDAYTGGISKNGDYAIDWTDNLCLAQATFKALATPYAIRNNNCQECLNVACNIEITDVTVFINGAGYFELTWTNVGGTPYSVGIEYSINGGITYNDSSAEVNSTKDGAAYTETINTTIPYIWRVVPTCDPYTFGQGELFNYYPPGVDPPTTNVITLRNSYSGSYNITRLLQDGVNIYVGAALAPGNDAILNISNIANPHYFGLRVLPNYGSTATSEMNLIRAAVVIKTFTFTPSIPDPVNTVAWTLMLGDIIEVKEAS